MPGAPVAYRQSNPIAMAVTQELNFARLLKPLPNQKKWPGADVNTAKKVHFVTGNIKIFD